MCVRISAETFCVTWITFAHPIKIETSYQRREACLVYVSINDRKRTIVLVYLFSSVSLSVGTKVCLILGLLNKWLCLSSQRFADTPVSLFPLKYPIPIVPLVLSDTDEHILECF